MPTLSGPLYDMPDVVADQQPQLLPVGQPQFDYVSPDTGRPRVVIDTSEKKPKLIAVDHDPFATVKKIGNKLFGLNGEERYQLWPEKVIREGLSAAHDVMTEGMLPPGLRREDFTDIPAPTEPTNDSTALGKFLNIAPVSTSPADKGIEQAQAMSALAGTGGLGGVGNEAGVALGSTPFLRPALKYEGKIYKAPMGGQHLDALPPELVATFQKQAMSGEDISNFKFGFMNHKGQFLDRDKALEYGINEGLLDPQDAKFGTLTSTMMSDSSKPGMALQANKPFYSAVENAVVGAKQPTADAQQWLGYLKNQPGVKQEELTHLGLDKLQGTISKEQLLQTVKEGQPQIKEVVKGVESNNVKKLRAARDNAENYGTHDEIVEANQNLVRAQASDNATPTKYHSYQLPGGENYREHLLTLPNKEQRQYGFEWFDPTTQKSRAYATELEAKTNAPAGAIVSKAEIGPTLNPAYKSSHWDEPNVLAHIRMNDRNIDGKKTLHVEEVQSDWHQEGRKKGYRNLAKEKEMQAKLDEAMNRTIALNHQMERLARNRDPVTNMIRDEKLFHELARQRDAAKAEMNEAANQINQGVPDAPFKKTWDELALKHILNHAVRNGYDQVSWTPGEAQAARYDLSKQVSGIHWQPSANKTSTLVQINPVNGSALKVQVDKTGKVLAGFPSSQTHQFEGKNLADVVGKEHADKILNKETGSLEGEGLKIGGEGMKAFYDKMLVDKMNAIGKKFGAKVEKGEIRTKSLDDLTKSVYGNDETFKSLPSELKDKILNMSTGKQPVYVLKITPELRNQVLSKGFPLFSMGLPIYNPVDHDPFKQEKSK